jgi:polysaccharide biosynthesis protein PslH
MQPRSGPVQRLVWITPKFPLGNPDGARLATCALIRHVVQSGVKVDLLCVLPEGESADAADARDALGVSSAVFVRRSASRWLPLPGWKTPFTFRTFAASEVQRGFRRQLARLVGEDPRHPAFVVFDGLHPFAALSPKDLQALSQSCRGVIYRAHNYETALWEQCAEQARMPWSRWFYRGQSALVKAFERRIVQNTALVAPVSSEDEVRFKLLVPRVVSSVVPIGMDFPSEEELQTVDVQAASLQFLFIGRLDWIPNKKGLAWFLEKIWPVWQAHHPDFRLVIAGVGDGRWLQPYAALPGLHYLGKVADVGALYRSSAAALAPLFQGSGTRVKILEAARYARPVISTGLGAEGTGLEDGISYYRAENENEWRSMAGTLSLENCQTVGLRAFRSARERFDGKSIAQKFLQTLQRLDAAPASPSGDRASSRSSAEQVPVKSR